MSRRLDILESREKLTSEQRLALERDVDDLIETRVIEVVPRDTYASLEQRVPDRLVLDWASGPPRTNLAALAFRDRVLAGKSGSVCARDVGSSSVRERCGRWGADYIGSRATDFSTP